MVGQLIAVGIQQLTVLLGAGLPWPANLEIIVPTLSAVGFALIVVYASNNDTLHGVFRRFRFTRETSYSSEWYSSFAENPNCYIVLHLKGSTAALWVAGGVAEPPGARAFQDC